MMICLAGGLGIILPACSGSSGNDCTSVCEPARSSGPQIDIAPGGAPIAAIETLTTGSASGVGGAGKCEVSWASWVLSTVGQAEPVCPALAVDAGGISDTCASRYPCEPPTGRGLDGGLACRQAWINVTADRCAVTVISTAGERQTFEVVETGTAVGSHCRTGTGECVLTGTTTVSPLQITISFENPGTAWDGAVNAMD
jgi:hypothetical protein